MGQLTAPTVLLVDADVLIDYRASDLEILRLVVRDLGRVAVLEPVLREVRGVTRARCAGLGIEVVGVETEQLLAAADIHPKSLSRQDWLNLVLCRERGWTCVTNDAALRRRCERHGVETRRGLRLMLCLVAAGSLPPSHALAVARQIHESNPAHIDAASSRASRPRCASSRRRASVGPRSRSIRRAPRRSRSSSPPRRPAAAATPPARCRPRPRPPRAARRRGPGRGVLPPRPRGLGAGRARGVPSR